MVTGSAYLVETGRARVLVDFGMFQGGKDCQALNVLPEGLIPDRLDAVVLTHAHLDHTGRLPLLAKAGYAGPIYATGATIELTGLILRDSAKVQAQDLERHNRRRERAGQPPDAPLYTLVEVEQILGRLQPVPYHQPVAVAPGVRTVFVEAGHMLGSASLQLLIGSDGGERRVVFSGDLGPRSAPILREFEPFTQADLLFLESTYGNRDHKPFKETIEEFTAIMQEAVAKRGRVLVPTFAVGRAQVLTLMMAGLFRRGVVPRIPVFLDSPMAIEASRIYLRHEELFDDEMLEFLREGSLMADLATLKATPTADDSKQINDVPGPCVILAGAGMCNAGRILHHLRNHLWRPETSVIIAGFQSEGSLGRMLVEGAEEVRIFGETIAVKARVHTLGGFSAHAGQTDLLKWFSALAGARPKVVLTHGEAKARTALAGRLLEQFHTTALLPVLGETVTL
jgi:metallo-beta-lactamase family protein